MASWKCSAYVVVGTVVIVLIILLNFDYLPKRKLSEELELSTKSSFKASVVPFDGLTTTSTSRVTLAGEKVRPLKFHGFCVNIPNVALSKLKKMFQYFIV